MKLGNLTLAEWLETYVNCKPLSEEGKTLLAEIEENPLSMECLVSFAGSKARREKFKTGEKRETLPEVLAKYGFRKRQCFNCAFLPNSEEMKQYRAEYPSQVSTILENIDEANAQNAPFEPFFCHQGMKTIDGGKSFLPPYDSEGLPRSKHDVCDPPPSAVK